MVNFGSTGALCVVAAALLATVHATGMAMYISARDCVLLLGVSQGCEKQMLTCGAAVQRH